ncbi:S-methyl-5-thioribose-1-phosphate isomerase [Puteibacter caeruleilacunae]|nr:S-methyl-5-thioribose-1-phosphate isomerase [Puteibacter caeruleilacunae]
MLINEQAYHTIWYNNENKCVVIIDQRKLPFSFETIELKDIKEAWHAIQDMAVRGAPLIGVTGAYGMYLGITNLDPSELTLDKINKLGDYLKSSRPTAVNLEIIIDELIANLQACEPQSWEKEALVFAEKIKQREIDYCSSIGDHGLKLIEEIAATKPGETINILTHCNAGWLACIDWGTATAPIYKAHQKGIDIHVWVDETRPRNQGAKLTAWELLHNHVPHTIVPDNTGGHLMQHGMVDLVIVGSDRTTRAGDVANKIGTYLKALAANDNNVPFFVALPSTTFDFNISDGVRDIPIEQRDENEVKYMEGIASNKLVNALIMPEDSKAANYGFDVTPARLVTGLITERGICEANETAISEKFKDLMS